MSLEENDKKEQQKQEEQEASKKALKTGAKTAANASFGPLAGKAVDLASKTKLGNAVLDKGANTLNKNPFMGKIVNAANKTGALDAMDKVGDTTSGSTEAISNIPVSNHHDAHSNNTNFTSSENSETNEIGNSNSDILLGINDNRKKKMIIISSIIGILVTIMMFIFSIGSILYPLYNASNFVKGIWDGILVFLGQDQESLEEKYYQELKDVQQQINREYHVCIDTNLITAALSVGRTFDKLVEDVEIDDLSGEMEEVDGTEIPYKRMIKQIKLLANMQIMRKRYGWDNSLKSSLGYCHEGETVKEEVVTSTTEDNFVGEGFLFFRQNGVDSSSPELIARHDASAFAAFFTKKANEEKNYAYYLYQPPFTYKEIKDKDGNVIGTEKQCDYELPDETAELSIGSYKDNINYVFYWNLVNSFIPDYYDEYLPSSEPERTEAIKKMADDIYLLYEVLGPNQTCSISYVGPSSLCPDGITVEGIGTLDLEEYVAGVVSNEAYCSEGMEALKAQAVAARTYALKTTNYCQNAIQNSTNAQTFTRNINDRAREAANSTLGEVLTYNGDIFSAQYDSFCYDDKDCPDATRNSDGTYTVTYTKVPSGERHTITLSDPSQYGRITHGQGHAHGMSQLLSYQMAKEGKNYQEILSYFYSSGVDITFIEPIGGSGSSVAGASVQEKLAYLFPSGLPASSQEASRYMTTVEFPVVDINGNKSTKRATVHQALAQDFVDIMTELANNNIPIKDVGCYNWRSAAASSSRSHHSYGVACDLNSNENYMIKNGQVVAGSYYKPGEDPYSFPANGVVVNTFAKYGWTWGGSWSSSKDYMHFSFTGY